MSNSLFESLRPGDLKYLVSNIFEIDSYSSKLGDDQDIVVLSFTVEDKGPADDLVNFIERGYEFVLDADASLHETKNGRYRVFVEIERSRHITDQILEILYGLEKLTGIKNFKFRYYKSFKSLLATKDNLSNTVPASKQDYQVVIKEQQLNNFSNFFNRSYLEDLNVADDNIIFRKMYAQPVEMRIIDAGPTEKVYENLGGRIMLENAAVAECMFLTKYIGNYNINKIGHVFVFENNEFAVALERL